MSLHFNEHYGRHHRIARVTKDSNELHPSFKENENNWMQTDHLESIHLLTESPHPHLRINFFFDRNSPVGTAGRLE